MFGLMITLLLVSMIHVSFVV
jgi:hypothetical protein